MSTIALTIRLDPEQFEGSDAIEFFHRELIGKVAQVHVDGYAFAGHIEGTATR